MHKYFNRVAIPVYLTLEEYEILRIIKNELHSTASATIRGLILEKYKTIKIL